MIVSSTAISQEKTFRDYCISDKKGRNRQRAREQNMTAYEGYQTKHLAWLRAMPKVFFKGLLESLQGL